MKCDELKSFIVLYDGKFERVYAEKKVDAAIAELKDETRKLKRALWLARAERAASWQIHFSLCHNHSIERQFSINGASMPCEGMLTMRTARDWAMIWEKVERKCRVKAAKVAAIKKGIDPDIAGNSSALIRHLVSEFLRSAE